jgi:pimeloyl-ACP methyl ester carboxylesterase
MATFVLVHGTGCGGWVWQKVTPLLRAAGHEVYTPTLTGVGDRSHLLACGVDLTTHITDIASLLFYEDLTDVVLVGHSYAGIVITGVAAQVPERLKLLVYLDAYVPADGQSEADLWPAELRAEIEAGEAAGNGLRQPPAPAWLGITEPDLADWIRARMTPHPLATYHEPVAAGNARSDALPRAYIHCTGVPTTPIFAPFAAKAKADGWQIGEISTSHMAMLTAPREVARYLQEFESVQ